MGQVDLHMVLSDIWVDPGVNVFVWIREDHVLIDDEEPVMLG